MGTYLLPNCHVYIYIYVYIFYISLDICFLNYTWQFISKVNNFLDTKRLSHDFSIPTIPRYFVGIVAGLDLLLESWPMAKGGNPMHHPDGFFSRLNSRWGFPCSKQKVHLNGLDCGVSLVHFLLILIRYDS